MNAPLAAAVAFFVLGVTFLSTLLLLLFNPRSASVRWYALFWVSIMAWLAAQGWAFATGNWEGPREVVRVAIHFAPALFLVFALVDGLRVPFRHIAALLLLAALLLPLELADPESPYAEWVLRAWNVVPWLAASVILWRCSFRDLPGVDRKGGLGRAVLILLFLPLPVAILGGTFGAFHVYAMPLLMVWIQGVVFVGVTHLRFYDIEVRAARTGEIASRAAEQERLAVLGELTASLAHEIRNPLTGVRSLAQRIAEEEVDEPRRRRYASVILEEVGRVERLVANLLGVAKRAPTAAAPAPTPLDPLFEDLLLLVGARAERAGVRLAADGGRITARAARETLAQLLLNLLLNAVAHSRAGGTVQLLAQRAEGAVEIRVRDAGPGIPPGERERIWDPFYSGTGSTGLGLAVVRRLAREEGWEVAVGDAPGGGAEFRVRIPSPAGVESAPDPVGAERA